VSTIYKLAFVVNINRNLKLYVYLVPFSRYTYIELFTEIH